MTFADRLREWDRAASAAPWRALLCKNGADFEPPTFIEPNINCGNGYEGEIKADDCRLIVALRNRAGRLADVVEKAEAVRSAFKAPWRSVPDMERVRYEAMESMFAALDALDRDGGEA